MTVQEKTMNMLNINAKLKELWNQEQDKNRIRACLFNLIIYSKKGGKDQVYEKLIQSVITRFPCRVIWIKESPEIDCLNANVRIVAMSSNIFCEIIEIETGGNHNERVSSLVLPQIVPDLPVYLLWTEDPSYNEPIFPTLVSLATKIIFDTSYIEDLNAFYLTTQKLSKQFPGNISDLNWSYFKGWRHLFAAVFNTQESLNILMNAQTLRITYHATTICDMKHNEIRAAYFQGWLASCLQWKFQNVTKKNREFHLSYRYANHDIQIILIPKRDLDCRELPSGVILSCEVENGDAHYVFKRQTNSRQVFTQYSDATHCELPFCHLLPGVSEGQEILEEIFYRAENKHFQNTLEIVSKIPWSAE